MRRVIRIGALALALILLGGLVTAPAGAVSYEDALVGEVAYRASGDNVYLGSPSIQRLPDGTILVSHDYFGSGAQRDRTEVYASTDEGVSWQHRATVTGQYWSTLFLHGDALYLMGTSRDFGAVTIRKSVDAGVTWTSASSVTTGLLLSGSTQYHTAPTPVLFANGRVYRAIEEYYGGTNTRPFMLSASVDADLLLAANWTKSVVSPETTYLEGNPVLAPDGQIWNVARSRNFVDRAGVFVLGSDQVSHDYANDIVLPGGDVKFTIRHDPVSDKYVTLVSEHTDVTRGSNSQRNVLSLIYSDDLVTWHRGDILVTDPAAATSWATSTGTTGFQYIDWQFDGDDIIYASRTAYAGANNFHDSNRITFHRVEGFRSMLQLDVELSRFRFEGNLGDAWSASPATAVGAVSYVAGVTGQAVHVDGTTAIDLGYRLGNEISGASAVTVSGWIKNVTIPSPGQVGNVLLGTRITGATAGLEIMMVGSSIRVAARSSTGDTYQYRDFPYDHLDEWHHLAAVIDFAGDSISLYLDGRPIAGSGTVDFALTRYTRGAPTQRDTIGASPAGGLGFHGAIDELSVYSVALDEHEIEAIVSEASLGHWRLGDDAATVLDYSRNGMAGFSRGVPLQSSGPTGVSLYFSGSEDVRLIAAPEAPLDDFTFSTWFSKIDTSGWQYLWSNKTDFVAPFVRVGFDQNSGRIRVYAKAAGGATSIVRSPDGYADGQWHHLAVVRAAGRVTVYVDSVAVADAPFLAMPLSGSGVWTLASDGYAEGNLVGSMGETLVFGYALTETQVAALFVEGEG